MAIILPFDFLFLDEAMEAQKSCVLFTTSDTVHALFHHTTYVNDHRYAISAAQGIMWEADPVREAGRRYNAVLCKVNIMHTPYDVLLGFTDCIFKTF